MECKRGFFEPVQEKISVFFTSMIRESLSDEIENSYGLGL